MFLMRSLPPAAWSMSPASSTIFDRSRHTPREFSRRLLFVNSRSGLKSRTSTTRRKTKYSPSPLETASRGACIAPTSHRLRARQRQEHGYDSHGLRQYLQDVGRPMVFSGSSAQWNNLTDIRVARVLANSLYRPRPVARPRIRPSTSSMATPFAGAGCGRASLTIAA